MELNPQGVTGRHDQDASRGGEPGSRRRSGTARGRLAASTTTMTTPATAVSATVSSAMNSWAAVSRPSQARFVPAGPGPLPASAARR